MGEVWPVVMCLPEIFAGSCGGMAHGCGNGLA